VILALGPTTARLIGRVSGSVFVCPLRSREEPVKMVLLLLALLGVVDLATGLDDTLPDDQAFAAAIDAALASDDPVVRLGPGTLILTGSPLALREMAPQETNRDLHGLRITGAGPLLTTVRGISANGFDVFQLNIVSNATIDSLAIESIKTGTSNTGCNGISLTNGCRNIVVRNVHVRGLPYVLLADRYDGGKGITVQCGTFGVERTDGIVIEGCRISDCPVGFGLDCDPALGLPPRSVSFVANVIERCCLPFYVSYTNTSLPYLRELICDIRITDNVAQDCRRFGMVCRAPRTTVANNVFENTTAPAIPDPYQTQWPDTGFLLAGGYDCNVTDNTWRCAWPQQAFVAIGNDSLPTVRCEFRGNTLSGPASFGFFKLPGHILWSTIRRNEITGSDVAIDPEF
jgi:hypothetical protein